MQILGTPKLMLRFLSTGRGRGVSCFFSGCGMDRNNQNLELEVEPMKKGERSDLMM